MASTSPPHHGKTPAAFVSPAPPKAQSPCPATAQTQMTHAARTIANKQLTTGSNTEHAQPVHSLPQSIRSSVCFNSTLSFMSHRGLLGSSVGCRERRKRRGKKEEI